MHLYVFVILICISSLRELESYMKQHLKQSLPTRAVILFETKLQIDDLIERLNIYKSKFGNINIPLNYAINANDTEYPVHLRNFSLGKTVRSLKYSYQTRLTGNDMSKLANLGFRFPRTSNDRFNTTIKAILMYRELNNGSESIPREFTIPCAQPWPEDTWRLRLGDTICNIRSGVTFNKPEYIARLNAINFVWNPQIESSKQLIATLIAFKNFYGHMSISKSFVVPSIPDFNKELWGMKLGMTLQNIRYRGDFKAVRQEIEELGLDLDAHTFDNRHWDYIYEALKTYKSIYGDLSVPSDFCVPKSTDWPENVWELKLGYRVRNIRYRGDFIKQNPVCRVLLDELGFSARVPRVKNGRRRSITGKVYGAQEIGWGKSIRGSKTPSG